jgi:hypothetical protein
MAGINSWIDIGIMFDNLDMGDFQKNEDFV